MSSKHDVIASYFEKFATTTVIRIFNFIRTAPYLVERIFWIVILVGFASLSVWDISQTIQKFLSEPTGSIVSFPVTGHDGLNFSDANLCVAMSKDSLLELYDNDTVVDDVTAVFASTPNITQHFRKKLESFHVAHEELTRLYSVSNANATASNDAFLAYYAELNAKSSGMFSRREIALLGLTTVMLEDLIKVEQGTQNRPTEVFHTKTADKFYTFYASRQTDFVELLQLTAEATCVLQRIRLFGLRKNMDTGLYTQAIFNVCKGPRELKRFGPRPGGAQEIACYRLPPKALVFYTVFDSVTITANVEMLYGNRSTTLASGFVSFMVDLGGALSSESGQAPLMAVLNQRQQVHFSFETWSTSANLRRSGCFDNSVDGIEFECNTWCRAELIMKACGCIPLINEFTGKFKTLRGSLGNCAGAEPTKVAFTSDGTCGHAIASSIAETRANCSRRCYRNCDTLLYSSAITPIWSAINESIFDSTNATTVVILSSSRTVYTRVVEYRTMDEKQLIVSLGGNLSLYLGASFLALIHIVVFFLKLPFDIAKGSQTSVTQAQSQPSATSKSESTVERRNLDETFAVIFAQLVNQRQQGRHTDRRVDHISKQIETILRRMDARGY